VLTVGSLIGNPIDGGFAVLGSPEIFMACLEALHDDPNIDACCCRRRCRASRVGALREISAVGRRLHHDPRTKPVSFVTLSSHSQTDYSRALRARTPHVSLLQEANKALRAIDRCTSLRARETGAQHRGRPPTMTRAMP